MNRKHNPLVALVALVLLAVILVSTCTGCAVRDSNHPGARFTAEHYDMDGSSWGIFIVTDTETGAQYLVYRNYQGAAMTVLQEKEG